MHGGSTPELRQECIARTLPRITEERCVDRVSRKVTPAEKSL
jgi:hypothetical protein